MDHHAFPATNPHDRLKPTVSALRFLGENKRIPPVFNRESERKKRRFEQPVRVGGEADHTESPPT